MTLRVAQIIGGLAVGGAERNLVNTFNAMCCEYRAAIFIGKPSSGPSFHGELDPEIAQHFVRVRRRSLPIGVMRLATLMRKLRLDIVHTHMFAPNLYGTIAAKLAGVPVIVTSEHGENPWKRPRHRLLERQVISRLADMRFCVSTKILSIRRDIDGVPASKLQLLVNGTTLPVLGPRRQQNPVPIIGAVGRFIPAKDYPRLLQAAAALRDSNRKFRVCIVGDGPEMPSVRAMVADLGLADIIELPGMAGDIGAWYRRFDIYVSSSVREGQPMALLEAMAYGLPVVSTDTGACATTVGHGFGGLVVPPGDTAALETALAQMIGDAELRSTCGANARRRVEERYSVQKVADAMTEVYAQILESKLAPGKHPAR